MLSQSILAQSQLNAQWVKQSGDAGWEYGFGIAVDDSANTFVTGLVGPGDTAFHNRSQCTNHDIFVARYDSLGNAKWLYKLGGLATDIGWGITVDKNHDICTVSSFMDPLQVNNDTIPNYGLTDMLVTKYSAQGELLWARGAGGSMDDGAYGIATDSRNNIYVAGSFVGTAHFDTLTLTSKGYRDMFLAKYSSEGILKWVVTAGGGSSNANEADALTIDAWDNIYVAGKFGDTTIFAADTVISRGNSDIFVARYDTLGAMQWVRQTGGPNLDIGQGIHTDTQGWIYVTGYFTQSAIFNQDSLISQGSSDMFISRYDPQGNLEWTKSAGGSGDDQGASVTVSVDKKIYVAGYFADTASFGAGSVITFGAYDAFFACVDTAGNFEWVKHGGGSGMDAASAVCADAHGAAYLTGTFDYTCSFDSITTSSTYDENLFVARFVDPAKLANGLPDNREKKLDVFPNPSNGRMFLQLGNEAATSALHVSIINSMGEKVAEKKVSSSVPLDIIDLSDCAKGMYFLEVNSAGKSYIKKIIIE